MKNKLSGWAVATMILYPGLDCHGLEAVGETGTVSFELVTDQSFRNGQGESNYNQKLFSIPGLNELVFRRTDSVVNLLWTWDERAEVDGKFHDIVVDFTDLPGPESYFLQFTWDSAKGLSEAYFNGQPLRIPGARFDPWWVGKETGEIEIGTGRLQVKNLQLRSSYTNPAEAFAAVPEEFRGRHSSLIGFPEPPQPLDVSGRRGEILYESMMDTPGTVEGWVAEGPLDKRFEDGALQMRSVDFSGNTVLWCPEEFPESFVAEWEFKPLSHYGLAIIFFAAKGENGEDIFDPALPSRDGEFRHYIRGAITSYHVSYFANVENFQMGRIDSNLRKNNQFYRVGGGPVAIAPGTEGWQHIRLVKDGNRIQLFANGQISVDWTDDDPERYGPPHGGGNIGFRQMSPTVGAYRNFRVWALETPSSSRGD